jgi:thiamine pyrophosphokinase
MLMDKHALLLCNGEPPSRALARRLARNVDLIVAADGGANVARTLGIRPHIIIGDFDSLTSATRRFFSSSAFIKISRQDNTDLEKSLDFLAAEKIPRVTVLAGTGKRLDHTLGNLSVMWNYVDKISIEFVGDDWTAIPVGKARRAAAKRGTTISLVPFGDCSGITLRGLRYPLTNATMRAGEIGVSNVAEKSPFTVSVKRGRMLMILLARRDSFRILS